MRSMIAIISLTPSLTGGGLTRNTNRLTGIRSERGEQRQADYRLINDSGRLPPACAARPRNG